jgi:hypothetical protein
MSNSHSRTNPNDHEETKRDERESDFETMSIADDVNANLERNVEGDDYQKAQQQRLLGLNVDILTKRQARKPAVIRRKLNALNNKTHDYVSLIQQANANFDAEVGKYNTTFQRS